MAKKHPIAFNIVTIKTAHIQQVVNIHMQAFTGFFLTFLGPMFLNEFYNSFTSDPAGIGFVGEDSENGDVLGVIVGPLIPDGYFKRLLKRRWWAFCLASVTAVLKRPSVIRRLFRALFYRGQLPPGPQRALLSSVAVSPQAQNRGIGKALVKRWVDEVKRRGSSGCFLTTDAHDNDKINRFYQRLGWQVKSTYTTPEGRVMNRYVLDFFEAPQGESK
jgi:ribosomal protein S18 acetylase RimI-like enzyme